jgi:hypothetical protein
MSWLYHPYLQGFTMSITNQIIKEYLDTNYLSFSINDDYYLVTLRGVTSVRIKLLKHKIHIVDDSLSGRQLLMSIKYVTNIEYALKCISKFLSEYWYQDKDKITNI